MRRKGRELVMKKGKWVGVKEEYLVISVFLLYLKSLKEDNLKEEVMMKVEMLKIKNQY
jgi:hypothetical protein